MSRRWGWKRESGRNANPQLDRENPSPRLGQGERVHQIPSASSGRGEAWTIEQSGDVAGGVHDADHLDAVRQGSVENEQSWKALYVPAPNVGNGGILETKEYPHFGHEGELVESLLSMVNKTQSHGGAGFGQEICSQFFDIPCG